MTKKYGITKAEKEAPRGQRRKLSKEHLEKAFLADISLEIEDIEKFLKGKKFLDFASDRLLNKAVIKSLESVGEAIKNLSPELQARHSNIQWRKFPKSRDFMAHHYWEIDHSEVWDLIKNYIPALLDVVREELKS